MVCGKVCEFPKAHDNFLSTFPSPLIFYSFRNDNGVKEKFMCEYDYAMNSKVGQKFKVGEGILLSLEED